MQISRQCDYAIRTILLLAKYYPDMLSVKEIATRQDIPKPFLNKIIQSLAKEKLVETVRGAQGGVRLWVSPDRLTLRNIIEAIDGPVIINRCLMGEGVCSRQSQCSVHRILGRARQKFLAELEKEKISDLLIEEGE